MVPERGPSRGPRGHDFFQNESQAPEVRMSNPLPYLIRMLLFLAVVAGIAFLLHHDLLRVFLNTPILNGVILGVLAIGIFFVMRQASRPILMASARRVNR